jgi:signal peptidase I
MTITAPAVEEQGWSDDGSSLLADPWSDNWTLPTAKELKAVGWPGARPGLVVDVRECEPVPVPNGVETANVPPGSSPDLPTEPTNPERPTADSTDAVNSTESDRSSGSKTQPGHRRHHSLRRLRGTVAMVAIAYWYFAVATLAIALIVPAIAGWKSTTVMSSSMAPTLNEGDVVAFSGHDGSLLEVGTIIQFTDPVRENSTVTHRIVGLNPDGTYETKGDANRGPDSVKVATSMITGVARMVSPYAGLPHFWLATGQYMWLAAWILGTAAAAMLMAPASRGVAQSARSAPETAKRFPRLRLVRRRPTSAQSGA